MAPIIAPMKVGRRFFLFESDGTLRRLALRLIDKLCVGTTELPEYAGQSLRAADLFLELDERRRPVRILEIQPSIFGFDESGNVRQSLMNAGIEKWHLYDELHEVPVRNGSVIDASARFREKRWYRQYRWEPTPEEIDQMVNAIWKPKSKP